MMPTTIYHSKDLILHANLLPLKVLFVSSGNLQNFDLAPFIKVQGDSLKEMNVDVSYFRISGKGLLGYLSNIGELKRFLKNSDFHLIHAHFTLSAWVAILAFPRIPIVLSLMGTDAYGRVEKLEQRNKYLSFLSILTYLIQPFVKKIISKSLNIERYVWLKKKSLILPNGVNLERFKPLPSPFHKELGLTDKKKYILFLGNPKDPRKNYELLSKCGPRLNELGFEILNPYPVIHEDVVKYLNTAELLVMCSLEEGSPNLVKEAMACNCKGVFTDVGDVKLLIENTSGYQICDFNTDDMVNKILEVADMELCQGREKLVSLELDLQSVAKKLRKVYLEVL
jgi:teichuronic acid biosynthesis glycosyltransferase TuaC